jgi:hypothetical protein
MRLATGAVTRDVVVHDGMEAGRIALDAAGTHVEDHALVGRNGSLLGDVAGIGDEDLKAFVRLAIADLSTDVAERRRGGVGARGGGVGAMLMTEEAA